jgi:uncharacterized protein
MPAIIGKVAYILIIIGAINWGLVGLLDLNLVTLIFASIPILVKLIYILVGISGIYALFCLITKKSCCS